MEKAQRDDIQKRARLWDRLHQRLARYMDGRDEPPVLLLVHPSTHETLVHPSDRDSSEATKLHVAYAGERIAIKSSTAVPLGTMWIVDASVVLDVNRLQLRTST